MIDVLFVNAKSEGILAVIWHLQYFAYAVYYDFEDTVLWNMKNKDWFHRTFWVYCICKRKDWIVDE